MNKLEYAKVYTYKEMEEWLIGMANAHPDKMKLKSLTETPEGRKVYLATLADFSSGESAEMRGAYFVKSGVHAQETAGPTAAMAVIERILCHSPEILQKTVFYVIPRVNPDGMELAITANFSMIRSKLKPIPGLPNALIPCDLNGDGMILSMRRKNPAGDKKELEGYPGVMVPREPGDEDGVFYDEYCEGYIENYDGGEPEIGFERVDLNRTQPELWRPVPGGEYPLREPEMRAVAEFEVTHHNIFAAMDFHCGQNAILRPVDRPDSEVNIDDITLIKKIGHMAEMITGFPMMGSYDEYKAPYIQPGLSSNGNSNIWNYEALGRSHYVIELGNGFNSIGLRSREILDEFYRIDGDWRGDLLKFHKEHGSEIFVPWEPFEHPQLGSVEIGGFKGGQSYYMYCPDMDNKIPLTTDFVLRHAAMTPKLRIENAETTKITDGVYRIRADIINVGELGTKVMQGATGFESFKKVRTFIKSNDRFEVLNRPAIYEHEQLKPIQRVSVEWFVRATAGSRITIVSENPRSIPAIADLNFS